MTNLTHCVPALAVRHGHCTVLASLCALVLVTARQTSQSPASRPSRSIPR
jgi:hypothetical protein